MSILFKNADILIREEKGYKVIRNGFLGVKDDKISYIGKSIPKEKYDEIKEYQKHLLIPGLINSHGHSPMTILRGVGSGLKFQEWLNNVIFPIEDKLVPYDVEVGTRLACLEMIASGTTCFSDMYDFPYSSALAIAESGLKANICRVGLCLPSLPFESPRFKEILDINSVFAGNFCINDEIKRELNCKEVPPILKDAISSDRLRSDLCIHSVYLTTEQFDKEIAKANKKFRNAIQIHLSETQIENENCLKEYGLTPTEFLYKCGVFDDGYAYCAHCVHLSDNDLSILKKTETSIVTNPSSNMKLSSGFASIRKAIDRGINVAIGTDGCASNNNLDLFEEMHVLALIQSGYFNDPTILSTTEIFDMATINGAKALHRKDIGKLEVGLKADIVAIDLNKPHLTPNLDTLSLLIYSAHGSDVSMTMVDGKILYENGRYFTLDYDKIMKEVKKVVDRLYK